jgi:hypothetical protein
MTPSRRTVVVAGLVIGATACGGGASSTTPAGPSSSSAPINSAAATQATTPTAPSTPKTFVLMVQNPTGVSVRFVRRDGTELRRVPMPAGMRFATVGGDRLFYVSAAHLHSLGADGSDHDMGALDGMQATNPGWGGLAVSPDGTRWAWSFLVGTSGAPMRSRMEVAGVGEKARVVLDASHDSPLYLEPIAWTEAGIVVADQPGNIGGFPLFFDDHYWWFTRLLDPVTFAQRTLSTGQPCPFNDIAADGDFTCLSAHPAQVVLTRGATRRTFALPGTVVNAGDALIDPAGRRIAIGINRSDSTGQSDQQWKVDIVMFDVATGAATALPFSGVVPVSWLPDGSLVVADVVNPDAGVQNSATLLAPDLRTRTELGPGAYLGALDARHAVATHAATG